MADIQNSNTPECILTVIQTDNEDIFIACADAIRHMNISTDEGV